MRYQVPQFIEMDDKIIGPFTLKQFIYLGSVPLACYIFNFFVELPYVILIGIIFFPIAVLLAFFKANGKPFATVVAGMLKFIKKPQTYIWKRTSKNEEESSVKQITIKKSIIKKKNKETNFKKIAQMLDSQQ